MPEMTAKPFRRLFKPNYLMVCATLGIFLLLYLFGAVMYGIIPSLPPVVVRR